MFKIAPTRNTLDAFRNSDNIPYLNTRHSFLKFQFQWTVTECNKSDPEENPRKCNDYNLFKSIVVKFIRPSSNSFVYHYCHIVIIYITRVRLDWSQLWKHKLKHNFPVAVNLICSCGNNVESVIDSFFHCTLYCNDCCLLLSSLHNIDHKLLDNTNPFLTQMLLFGKSTFDANDTLGSSTQQWNLSCQRRE